MQSPVTDAGRGEDVALCYFRLQALAREVAYELIPFSQRRRLHAAVAEAQEAALRRGDTGPQAPTAANIAYNYSAACATVEVTEWRRALLVRHGVTTSEAVFCTPFRLPFTGP